jgi:hypothetical protein
VRNTSKNFGDFSAYKIYRKRFYINESPVSLEMSHLDAGEKMVRLGNIILFL